MNSLRHITIDPETLEPLEIELVAPDGLTTWNAHSELVALAIVSMILAWDPKAAAGVVDGFAVRNTNDMIRVIRVKTGKTGGAWY
jgi:hypothetical protein